MGRPSSAAPGLADVVRGPEQLSAKSVVPEFLFTIVTGNARSFEVARKKSIPRKTAKIYPRGDIRLRIRNSEAAEGNRPVVQRKYKEEYLPPVSLNKN